jgi:hypothetical protein
MLAIQSTTAVWKLPSLLKLLSNGGPLFRRRDGNFHTAVVLWMASMWRSPVLGILALCTETTRASSPLSSWPWSTQTTSFILHYTPGSGESVVKYSLMVLHVSDGKRVHQALVDPKSIVPYYLR